MRGENHDSIKNKWYNLLEILNQLEFIKGEVAFYNKWDSKKVDKLQYQHRNYKGLFWWYNKILTEIAHKNKQYTTK